MVTVLILPPPLRCGCPLYHTGKHESFSSVYAVGSASKAFWVS